MPVNKLPQGVTTGSSTDRSSTVEPQKPRLNEWSPVAETRLPRAVMSEVHARGLGNADVMLVGPNEFIIGAKAGGPGVHLIKDDPDDFNAAFQIHVGTLTADGTFEVARAERAPEAQEIRSMPAVVGDPTQRDAGAHQALGGGMGVLLGSNNGVLFSDLPKAIQLEVKEHIEKHNRMQSMSMSPEKLEFLRAEERGGAFDVTFAVRNWMGQVHGERSARFGEAAPVKPPAPTVAGAAITALEQLPASARTAIEGHIEAINERESMSMSPRTLTFVSATPLSDGGFDVTLHGASMFGDGDDEKHRLSADGRFG